MPRDKADSLTWKKKKKNEGQWGPGGLPPEKFLKVEPYRISENALLQDGLYFFIIVFHTEENLST